MSETSVDHRRQRFGWLIERKDGRDFPFYDGQPVEVATWKWLVIIASCVAGFLALTLIPEANNVGSLLTRFLFAAIPFSVFIALTGGFWKSIFRKLTGRDFLDMVIFWLLNLIVSAAVGAIVFAVFGANANTATDSVLDGGPAEVIAFYVGTGVQLFGEEIFTILPFLAVMYLLYTKARLTRTASILLAWFITAIWFGAAHLPTYDWNFAQALLIIGAARLVLTLAFIRTKNILVSTGAHILNDWSSFTLVLIAASLTS
ncbi:CPBP family intramembrane glutamic endopeptidase [Arthrobacter sp. Soil762]|uniref:CPBP family intramembrane glutamic endopeptidase n=1 Tax=Arthrobacter sp. Soil762 TaxID=1736401 RepID=UPI0006FFE1B4|nr:CPBP family intramembrane glutamic endopeptidase [Arthrobacter sp. Soil762]KRE72653.1 peptidase [Arthrobacter sp. Soil762]